MFCTAPTLTSSVEPILVSQTLQTLWFWLDLDHVKIHLFPFSNCYRKEVDNVSTNQRPRWPSCFPIPPPSILGVAVNFSIFPLPPLFPNFLRSPSSHPPPLPLTLSAPLSGPCFRLYLGNVYWWALNYRKNSIIGCCVISCTSNADFRNLNTVSSAAWKIKVRGKNVKLQPIINISQ